MFKTTIVTSRTDAGFECPTLLDGVMVMAGVSARAGAFIPFLALCFCTGRSAAFSAFLPLLAFTFSFAFALFAFAFVLSGITRTRFVPPP